MAKIIELNNNNHPETDVSKETIWIQNSRERWDNFVFKLSKYWFCIYIILIIIYCFGFINISIIYFIPLVNSPFIPIAVIRFPILKFLFNKFPP